MVTSLSGQKTVESNILTYHVEINKKESQEVILNDTVLSINNATSPTFSINLDENAGGNLTIIVGEKTYSKSLQNGKATVEINDLPAGNYTATVIYTGDENHARSETTSEFEVMQSINPADQAIDVNVPEASTNPTFTINLPGASGNLTVVVDGKTYTKALVNGSATITIEDLTPENHDVTVSYTSDGNHTPLSKNLTISIQKQVLSDNKDVVMLYSSGASYKVRVTIDGKPVVGEKVTIKFNGNSYIRTTDKKVMQP